MKKSKIASVVMKLAIIVCVFILAGCGGGGGDESQGEFSKYSGSYSGEYTGIDSGIWNITVTSAGVVTGWTYSRANEITETISGFFTSTDDFYAAVGTGSAGVSYTGTMDTGGIVTGVWKNANYQTGPFSGKKTAEPPITRFIDKGNGTLYDTFTNLTWLKDANCFGPQTWDNAMAKSNSLASGQCGLSDNSKAGDWHLPTYSESKIFIDAGYLYTTLNKAGFSNIQPSVYWSSDTRSPFSPSYPTINAYDFDMGKGNVSYDFMTNTFHVWAVRAGQ